MSPFDNPEVVALLRDLDLRPFYRFWPVSARCAYDNYVLSLLLESERLYRINRDSFLLSKRNKCRSIQNVSSSSYHQLSVPFE